jgi:hypothetical protein
MYPWLEIEPLRGLLQQSPLLGYCPPINVEDLKEMISQKLEIDVVSINHKWQYSLLEESRKRLPINQHQFNYSLNSFEGIVEAYFSKTELQEITQKILGGDCPLGESSKEAVIDFFVSGLILSFISQPTLEAIQPRPVAKTAQIKSQKVLEGVVEIKFQDTQLQIYFLVEDSIYQQWLKNWSQSPYLGIDSEKAENIHLPLHVKLSQIEIPAGQLQKLKVGDWICLKEVGLNEAIEGCHLELTLSGQKLGEAQLKKGQVLIASRDEFFDRLRAN